MKNAYYLLISAVAAAAVLGLEVLAARSMAPVIGTGSMAWSALLAAALASLAAGNMLGGRLANRFKTSILLGVAIAAAAVGFLLNAQYYSVFMRWAGEQSPILGAMMAAVLLQIVPMTALGALTPVLVACGGQQHERGHWAGAVLAAGSVGGVTGVLIVGLVMLPQLGLSNSYSATAAMLAVMAIPSLWPRRAARMAASLLVIVAVSLVWLKATDGGDVIQSAYGQIEVHESEMGKIMLVDGLTQTAAPGEVAAWEGMRNGYLLEVALLMRPYTRDALVVGLGAGLANRVLESHDIECEAVELDPKVVETARRHFGFRGNVHIGDGRTFARRTNRQWDIVVLDVCTSERLPAHLFTVEGLRIFRQRLRPGGILAVQVIGDDGPWMSSLISTARSVFKECIALAPAMNAERAVGTRWLFASQDALPLPEITKAIGHSPLPWREIRRTNNTPPLTDDHFIAESHWNRVAVTWRRTLSMR